MTIILLAAALTATAATPLQYGAPGTVDAATVPALSGAPSPFWVDHLPLPGTLMVTKDCVWIVGKGHLEPAKKGDEYLGEHLRARPETVCIDRNTWTMRLGAPDPSESGHAVEWRDPDALYRFGGTEAAKYELLGPRQLSPRRATKPVASVRMFSPQTGTWTSLPDLPAPIAHGQASHASTGAFVVCGEASRVDSKYGDHGCFSGDATTGTWTDTGYWMEENPEHGELALQDGTLFAIGGLNHHLLASGSELPLALAFGATLDGKRLDAMLSAPIRHAGAYRDPVRGAAIAGLGPDGVLAYALGPGWADAVQSSNGRKWLDASSPGAKTAGAWQEVPAPPVPAPLQPDGRPDLIAGSRVGFGPMYPPAVFRDGEWVSGSPPPIELFEVDAAVVGDTVWVSGVHFNGDNRDPVILVWNPQANTWTRPWAGPSLVKAP